MSIYRTGNSPFWHVRIYDNLRKRYIVRSSKEKARLTAKEVAEELFDEHRSKKNQAVAVSRDTSFRHYAEKLQAHEKAMAARMRGKRFFTDTRAILAPTVRKGSTENAAFDGDSALHLMLSGELTDIMRVRHYLDAECGGA